MKFSFINCSDFLNKCVFFELIKLLSLLRISVLINELVGKSHYVDFLLNDQSPKYIFLKKQKKNNISNVRRNPSSNKEIEIVPNSELASKKISNVISPNQNYSHFLNPTTSPRHDNNIIINTQNKMYVHFFFISLLPVFSLTRGIYLCTKCLNICKLPHKINDTI